jgi:hypothetical protein
MRRPTTNFFIWHKIVDTRRIFPCPGVFEPDHRDDMKIFNVPPDRFGHHSHVGCEMAIVGVLGNPESVFNSPMVSI